MKSHRLKQIDDFIALTPTYDYKDVEHNDEMA
jgi:hypothetical protein